MRDRMAELGQTWRRLGFDVGFRVGITLGYATLGQYETAIRDFDQALKFAPEATDARFNRGGQNVVGADDVCFDGFHREEFA